MKYTFDWNKIESIGIGALVAASGAVLTYALEHITGTEFGSFTPVVVAVLSVLANALRKWIQDNPPLVAGQPPRWEEIKPFVCGTSECCKDPKRCDQSSQEPNE